VPGPTLAAPEIIIVYGGLLSERRVISDWHENHALLLSRGPGGTAPAWLSAPPQSRPALKLALFWGHGWRTVAQSPERLRALRPEQASQSGMFYPATDTAPALLALGSDVRTMSEPGLAIMRRHGVPTHVP
jgi:hypothetical protein